jgi:uncharacterized protein YjgD (DUF1641 family)
MEPDLARKLDDLDQRLQRLENALSGFSRLADRIERIEALVDTLGTLAERLPTITDAAGAGVAFAARAAEARGIDPISTGVRASELGLELMRPHNLALAEQLAQPENAALVTRLLARRPLVEKLLDATDTVDETALVSLARDGSALAGKLAKLTSSPALGRFLDVAASDRVLDTAEHATTALVDARSRKPEQVGMFGALGKLGDPDVKRAVGFTLALAKRFGQLLDR